MAAFTDILTSVTGAVLTPLGPGAGIGLASLLTAVFILLVYKFVSNQAAITKHKNRVFGHFLEIYLFRDSPGLIAASLGRVLKSIAGYLAFSLPALLVVLVPIVLLLGQMEIRYGRLYPAPGSELIVKAEVEKGTDLFRSEPVLDASGGLEVVSPALRIENLSEVNWKVRVKDSSPAELVLRIAGEEFRRPLNLSGDNRPIYPASAKGGLLNAIEYPGQPRLPADSVINRVEIEVPTRYLDCLLLDLHWIVIYFVLSLILAFALKKPFRVEF